MKRILIFIAAIILALSLLAGCEAPIKIPEPTPAVKPSPSPSGIPVSHNIPDINIEDDKTSSYFWLYEDDENIYDTKSLK